jgi:hypothetical protein
MTNILVRFPEADSRNFWVECEDLVLYVLPEPDSELGTIFSAYNLYNDLNLAVNPAFVNAIAASSLEEELQYFPLFEDFDIYTRNQSKDFRYSDFLKGMLTHLFYGFWDDFVVGSPMVKMVKGDTIIDVLEYDKCSESFEFMLRFNIYHNFPLIDEDLAGRILHSVKKNLGDVVSAEPSAIVHPTSTHEQDVEEMKRWFRAGFKNSYFKKRNCLATLHFCV